MFAQWISLSQRKYGYSGRPSGTGENAPELCGQDVLHRWLRGIAIGVWIERLRRLTVAGCGCILTMAQKKTRGRGLIGTTYLRMRMEWTTTLLRLADRH